MIPRKSDPLSLTMFIREDSQAFVDGDGNVIDQGLFKSYIKSHYHFFAKYVNESLTRICFKKNN